VQSASFKFTLNLNTKTLHAMDTGQRCCIYHYFVLSIKEYVNYVSLKIRWQFFTETNSNANFLE